MVTERQMAALKTKIEGLLKEQNELVICIEEAQQRADELEKRIMKLERRVIALVDGD